MEQSDTPRTNAIEFRHCPPQPKELLKKHHDAYALSRQLERELAASKDEVERLKSDKTHLITQCANLLEELSEIKETYASIVQQPHFDEREVHCSCVPALRAEVERLKHLLSDLLILTEKNYWNSYNYNQIKLTYNSLTK